MKFLLALILSTSGYSTYAKDFNECITFKDNPDSYKRCQEIVKSWYSSDNPDCPECKPDLGSIKSEKRNPWLAILSGMAHPISYTGKSYMKDAPSAEQWGKAFKEGQDKIREDYKDFLKKYDQNGELTPNESLSLFRKFQSYQMLEQAYGFENSKDMPTFKEFVKNSEKYLTKSGFETIIHPIPSKSKKCSTVDQLSDGKIYYNGKVYREDTSVNGTPRSEVGKLEQYFTHDNDVLYYNLTTGSGTVLPE